MLAKAGAQSKSVSDAGLWVTLSLQKTLNKRMNLNYDQEFRLKENYQRVNLFYSNLGLSYKFTKNLKGEISYRAIQKIRLDQSVSHRHRIQFDLNAKKKFSLFSVSERIRYQAELQDIYSSRKGFIPESFIRLKTEAKYETDKFYIPYASVEFRYQLTAPRGKLPEYNYGFRRVRFIFGTELKLSDSGTLNLYYLVQREFDILRPENTYIMGIQYTHSF